MMRFMRFVSGGRFWPCVQVCSLLPFTQWARRRHIVRRSTTRCLSLPNFARERGSVCYVCVMPSLRDAWKYTCVGIVFCILLRIPQIRVATSLSLSRFRVKAMYKQSANVTKHFNGNVQTASCVGMKYIYTCAKRTEFLFVLVLAFRMNVAWVRFEQNNVSNRYPI